MSLLEDLNLDPETATWLDFSLCRGLDSIDPNLFYDTYENDQIIADQVDIMCSRCPVLKACKNAALNNKEYGVWAATYWTEGKRDRVRNKHKQQEILDILEERLDG